MSLFHEFVITHIIPTMVHLWNFKNLDPQLAFIQGYFLSYFIELCNVVPDAALKSLKKNPTT